MAANEISGALRARPAMDAIVSLIYTIIPKAAAGDPLLERSTFHNFMIEILQKMVEPQRDANFQRLPDKILAAGPL